MKELGGRNTRFVYYYAGMIPPTIVSLSHTLSDSKDESGYLFRRFPSGDLFGGSSPGCVIKEASTILVMSQRGWLLSACQ
jgi:hypothetical protein